MNSAWLCSKCGTANNSTLTHCSVCRKPFWSLRKRNGGQRAASLSRRTMLTGLVLAGVGAGIGGLFVSRLLQSLRPSLFYRGHTSSVVAVAWSSDGKLLASCDSAGAVQVWEAGTGKTLFTYQSPVVVAPPLAWSPSGIYLVAQSATPGNGLVYVWEATSGRSILTYRGHTRQVNTLAWAPSGKLLASCSSDGTLQAWDATTGRHFWTSPLTPAWFTSAIWSPDGSRIVSVDRQVSVRNAAKGTTILTHQELLPYSSSTIVAWSPSGKQLVTVCQQDTGNSDDSPPPPVKAQIWDAITGRPVIISPTGDSGDLLQEVAWTSDGKRVVFTDTQTVWVWEARNGGQFSAIPLSIFPLEVTNFYPEPNFEAQIFSPDGQRYAAAYGTTVVVWDVPCSTGGHASCPPVEPS